MCNFPFVLFLPNNFGLEITVLALTAVAPVSVKTDVHSVRHNHKKNIHLTLENKTGIKCTVFVFFAPIDCGCSLEPLRRGGSNVYPQFMFWIKNEKNVYIYSRPVYPSFTTCI